MARVTVYVPTDMDYFYNRLPNDSAVISDTALTLTALSSTARFSGFRTGNQFFVKSASIDTRDDGRTTNFSIGNANVLISSKLLLKAALATVLSGNDWIAGSDGADVLSGHTGNDTYVVTASDGILEAVDGGNDTVVSATINLHLAKYANVENVKLTGNIALFATASGGSNVLDGSANRAANRLTGLGGNDTYVLGLGDLPVEPTGGGTDTVQSSVRNLDLTLFRNVENANLTGIAAHFAKGTIGRNSLSGMSNPAANVLTGLAGDDTYIVGLGDRIVETLAGGSDTVQSATISLNLANYVNVENVHLLGAAARSATGNSGNNVLNGEGNTSGNTLKGLSGDDTYFVGRADVVLESIGGGIDTVRSSSLSMNLANYLNVENITLSGSASLFARGNSAANILNGTLNSAANSLSGGSGEDTYVVGPGDTVYDSAGLDLVRTTTININLSNGQIRGVENATLSGTLGLSVVGSAADNVIVGNHGANNLSGEGGNDTVDGGFGSDTLSGGLGLDTFIFKDDFSFFSNDVITDFVAAEDTIQLASASFTAITFGTLSDAAFYSGAGANAAQTASHRIIYNQTTGEMRYDADGAGVATSVHFVTLGLAAHPADVRAANFVIV